MNLFHQIVIDCLRYGYSTDSHIRQAAWAVVNAELSAEAKAVSVAMPELAEAVERFREIGNEFFAETPTQPVPQSGAL